MNAEIGSYLGAGHESLDQDLGVIAEQTINRVICFLGRLGLGDLVVLPAAAVSGIDLDE